MQCMPGRGGGGRGWEGLEGVHSRETDHQAKGLRRSATRAAGAGGARTEHGAGAVAVAPAAAGRGRAHARRSEVEGTREHDELKRLPHVRSPVSRGLLWPTAPFKRNSVVLVKSGLPPLHSHHEFLRYVTRSPATSNTRTRCSASCFRNNPHPPPFA